MVAKVDESRLLERARAWEEEALLQIYDLYRPVLYRYAYRLLGREEEAEECVAEVFARFLFALRRGQGPQWHLRAYLYRMVHNWVQDRFREQPVDALDDVERTLSKDPVGSTTEEEAVRRWRAERLRQALRRLPPRQAQVLSLRFLQGFTFEEIAEVVGTSVGAVKALQHRGLENLRRLLKEEDL